LNGSIDVRKAIPTVARLPFACERGAGAVFDKES
jgi:hypothetical protein